MTVTLTNHKSTFYAFNVTSAKFTTLRDCLKVNNVSCHRRISRDTCDGNPRIHQEARDNAIRKKAHIRAPQTSSLFLCKGKQYAMYREDLPFTYKTAAAAICLMLISSRNKLR